ncbi:hypothetical protein AVEN_222154-1 [Araneus ventricosus]|uniref:Uncharacterized protein n=1 Tax=Araneus ventricosus TaxID=182803 RepID=A0A4Y2SEL5_ARAVE|nr:hypothetical protein AVEN_222154-1 [Araneus ventricosus]
MIGDPSRIFQLNWVNRVKQLNLLTKKCQQERMLVRGEAEVQQKRGDFLARCQLRNNDLKMPSRKDVVCYLRKNRGTSHGKESLLKTSAKGWVAVQTVCAKGENALENLSLQKILAMSVFKENCVEK